MKKISFAIACIAVLSVFATPAAAQTLAKASVPFSFSVHDKTFPAGTYEVRYLGGSMLRLQDAQSGVGVTLMAPSAIRESVNMHLIFRQYGDQSFLAAITDKTLRYEADVPKSNSERDLQKPHRTPTIVALRASK